jgi:hypothetical protein
MKSPCGRSQIQVLDVGTYDLSPNAVRLSMQERTLISSKRTRPPQVVLTDIAKVEVCSSRFQTRNLLGLRAQWEENHTQPRSHDSA